jgi:hypothetical protein
MTLALAACIGCLILFVVLFLIWPLLESKASETQGFNSKSFEDYRQLFHEREALLESLKDLEVDFQTGKISEQDRQPLKQDLSAKLMNVLHEIERIEKSESFFLRIQKDLKERETLS